ncbi:hypothetical protein HPB47_025976 [Ixodes persulcatus]|uniref:Uncharacterized protein n=1 Tax=Ixodes persulcatus TaxID=34615 RepID=A0AC60Q006_IXOPE|nr:hypothetical protein HPB47_025976 [Ixodes persulcatus]
MVQNKQLNSTAQTTTFAHYQQWDLPCEPRRGQLENIFKWGKATLTGSVTAPMDIFSVDRNLAERLEEDARIDRALLEIQLAAAKLQAHADRLQI